MNQMLSALLLAAVAVTQPSMSDLWQSEATSAVYSCTEAFGGPTPGDVLLVRTGALTQLTDDGVHVATADAAVQSMFDALVSANFSPGGSGGSGPLVLSKNRAAMWFEETEFMFNLFEHSTGVQLFWITARRMLESTDTWELRHEIGEVLFEANGWASIDLSAFDPQFEAVTSARSHWRKQKSDGTYRYRTTDVEKRTGESTESWLKRADKVDEAMEKAGWENVPPPQQESASGPEGADILPFGVLDEDGDVTYVELEGEDIVLTAAGLDEIQAGTALGDLLIDVIDALEAGGPESGGVFPLTKDPMKAINEDCDGPFLSSLNLWEKQGVQVLLVTTIKNCDEDTWSYWNRVVAAEQVFEDNGWATVDPMSLPSPPAFEGASGDRLRRTQHWSKGVYDDDGNRIGTRYRTTVTTQGDNWSDDKWEFYAGRTQQEMFEAGWALQSTNDSIVMLWLPELTQHREIMRAA